MTYTIIFLAGIILFVIAWDYREFHTKKSKNFREYLCMRAPSVFVSFIACCCLITASVGTLAPDLYYSWINRPPPPMTTRRLSTVINVMSDEEMDAWFKEALGETAQCTDTVRSIYSYDTAIAYYGRCAVLPEAPNEIYYIRYGKTSDGQCVGLEVGSASVNPDESVKPEYKIDWAEKVGDFLKGDLLTATKTAQEDSKDYYYVEDYVLNRNVYTLTGSHNYLYYTLDNLPYEDVESIPFNETVETLMAGNVHGEITYTEYLSYGEFVYIHVYDADQKEFEERNDSTIIVKDVHNHE